jgi:hypothetical protein
MESTSFQNLPAFMDQMNEGILGGGLQSVSRKMDLNIESIVVSKAKVGTQGTIGIHPIRFWQLQESILARSIFYQECLAVD